MARSFRPTPQGGPKPYCLPDGDDPGDAPHFGEELDPPRCLVTEEVPVKHSEVERCDKPTGALIHSGVRYGAVRHILDGDVHARLLPWPAQAERD